MEDMSRRHKKTLELLAKGWKNREIAEHLGTTEQTVKNYCRLLYKVTQCRNRVELALYVIQHPSAIESLPL